jgi:hypothetical protein
MKLQALIIKLGNIVVLVPGTRFKIGVSSQKMKDLSDTREKDKIARMEG